MSSLRNIASECFLLSELVGNVLITKHRALKDEGISEIKKKKLRYCVVLKKVWDSAFLCTHTRGYKRDLYLTVSRHVPIF